MASLRRRPTVTVPGDYPVKVATNATIFIFIKSDGVVVIFSAGQHPDAVTKFRARNLFGSCGRINRGQGGPGVRAPQLTTEVAASPWFANASDR